MSFSGQGIVALRFYQEKLYTRIDTPTVEPHLKIHRVMTEHMKSKFNNLIY